MDFNILLQTLRLLSQNLRLLSHVSGFEEVIKYTHSNMLSPAIFCFLIDLN